MLKKNQIMLKKYFFIDFFNYIYTLNFYQKSTKNYKNPHMKLLFSVKQLGKRRPFIQQKSIDIDLYDTETYLLKDLLTQIVTQQVAEFNQKIEDTKDGKNLFTFFEEHEIQEEAHTGKVRFGAIYNDKKANLDKAIETVLLAFFDGLIAVFIDETQIEKLETPITIKENSLITFVRLTFLVGR